MSRTKNPKVWNEDLVLALRSREEQCRQRCSVRQYLWRDGAKALEAVRRDIYQCQKSSKVVGLPTGLNKTVEEECRAIISGSKPILPSGFIPTTLVEQRKMSESRLIVETPKSNPYYDDPYLKRIKMRGGSYAILMAFHFSRAKSMTKAQLCSAAQHYCDEEMEPNFSAGRSYGAWSSKKTLVNHGIVKESRTTQMGRRGHICNGVFEYSLTENGQQFLEAMLHKFPLTGKDQNLESVSVNHSSEIKKSLQMISDRNSVCNIKQPEMNRASRNQHKSNQQRIQRSRKASITVTLLSDSDSDSEDDDACAGRGSPITNAQSNPKIQMNDENISPIFIESESDNSFTTLVRKASLQRAPKKVVRTTSKSDRPMDNVSSDDDEDFLVSPVKAKTLPRQPKPPLERTDYTDSLSTGTHLIILIDSRERNRNATPRHMRMELNRNISDESGLIRKVWPKMPLAIVEEDELSYGDFAFLQVGSGKSHRVPVSIERKRISDLVQRSHRADHWMQLSRMARCCDHAILLVEGNITKTSHFTSKEIYEDEPPWNPDLHSIDDENSFYRFLGRAIVASSNFKLIQTRDEQASYRAIGAVGLVSTQIHWKKNAPRVVSSAKRQVNQLYDKLKSRGIPWQISRRVSEEVVSVQHLENLFNTCQISARSSILSPIIAQSCSCLIKTEKSRRLIEYGSVEAWSAAIYNAWNSKLTDPRDSVSVFEEYKVFANDRAKLLASLHEGKSAEHAVYESNKADSSMTSTPRMVIVEGNRQLTKFFPTDTSDCFYKISDLEENPLGLGLPSIVMHTVGEKFKSDRLVLSVLEGTNLLQRIKSSSKGIPLERSITIAESVARQLYTECNSFLLRKPQDRSVLIVRGLTPALDAAAKEHGYQEHLKIMADLCLADLMLRHGIVVVHAFRLKGDLEMILREFAMACFHYQLLTRKVR
ncbi:ERCC4 domain containing protein [Nitzschia inconspicua]|uniref:ERCC4 domain containing protein n=1 Tax=Nitzschia inconspicua TaxID=303405 RepID=A0A9K3PZV9_9STRA|nr:ERCC4 domain containing protein [Nitzschia inconspicua]